MFVINIVITSANIAKKMEIKNIYYNKLRCFFFALLLNKYNSILFSTKN